MYTLNRIGEETRVEKFSGSKLENTVEYKRTVGNRDEREIEMTVEKFIDSYSTALYREKYCQRWNGYLP